MFPDVVEALLGRRFTGRPARLVGYARLALRGRVYPAIVARDGASTEGVLYEGVDDASLAKLDEFEGETYERRTVEVIGASSPSFALAAEAYVIAPGRLDLLERNSWDPEQFRALHHERYVVHCRSLRARGGGAVAFESRDPNRNPTTLRAATRRLPDESRPLSKRRLRKRDTRSLTS